MNIEKVYVVSVVDVGDTCDGHARILGAFKDRGRAVELVKSDMEYFVGCRSGSSLSVDLAQMEVVDMDEDKVTCWSVDEVEIQ